MRTVKDAGEFGLLSELALFSLKPGEGWVGPGDDCAIIPRPKGFLAVTTDLLIEDVHFRLATTGPFDLGWKAVAVNLSDLASTGAKPLALTVSAGLPPSIPLSWAKEFYSGLLAASSVYGGFLVGGDTSSAEKVCLSVTAIGDMEGRAPVLRSGAAPGDDLWLSGFTGESAAGLTMLEGGFIAGIESEKMILRHRRPEPRVQLGIELAANSLASAMIDVSDGVLADFGHIAKMSRVRLVIEKEKVPISPELALACAVIGKDPLSLALGGGEDYELAFSARPEKRGAVGKLRETLGIALTRVGRAEKGAGIALVDENGAEAPMPEAGFEHFSTRA